MADQTAPSPSLYVTDEALRQLICPHVGKDRFRGILLALEARGFPPINSLWRGRYWPAVRQWLDADNGIGKTDAPGYAEDGQENWDGAEKPHARTKEARAH